MKVTVIPLVIGALGTVHKSLEKGVEDLEIGRWYRLQYCRDRPVYWGDSCGDFCKRLSANASLVWVGFMAYQPLGVI